MVSVGPWASWALWGSCWGWQWSSLCLPLSLPDKQAILSPLPNVAWGDCRRSVGVHGANPCLPLRSCAMLDTVGRAAWVKSHVQGHS